MKVRCVYCAKMLRRKSEWKRVPYRTSFWFAHHRCCLDESACARREQRKVNRIKRDTLVSLGFMDRAVR